jgi:hypothetical protein
VQQAVQLAGADGQCRWLVLVTTLMASAQGIGRFPATAAGPAPL